MKYYRFMGNEELKKLLSGEILENHTKWNRGRGLAKTCTGFCFFDNLYPPEERLKFAFGAMYELNPVCVLFKPGRGTTLCKGYGFYAKPSANRMMKLNNSYSLDRSMVQIIQEYSLEQYSMQTMHVLKVGVPYHGECAYEWHINWLEDIRLSEIRKGELSER